MLPILMFAQPSAKEQARELARTQIIGLKSSTLLVRLYTKKNVIEALESQGMAKRAAVVKRKQEKVNAEIIESFQKFDFCSVYFFYSDQSDYIVDKNYSKVDLFDKDGVLELQLDGPNFFVADFGVLKNENSTIFKNPDAQQTGRTKVKTYKGRTSTLNKRCMYLRNSELQQLKRPFPYTVWFHPTPVQRLSYEEVVSKMNEQLQEFYSSIK